MSEDERRPTVGDRDPSSADDGRSGAMVYVADVVSSASAVLLVGLLLFAVSGVWPPLVAIESPSMEPHIDTGDLVFVMEEDRFPGPNARHGVTTAAGSRSYVRFQETGDVIVYAPDGNRRTTPIIHRAMLWVDAGENWYDRADPQDRGSAQSCADLTNCPAPHSGFITKGDNNARYDQVGSAVISAPVKPQWVVGTAELRVPFLGQIRLRWNQAAGQQVSEIRSVENATSGSAGALEAGA
jgi:signal peptidase